MEKLYIEEKGVKVALGQLETILNKQQAVIGNSERDLILRTAGNIKIQVGNKFYDLPITSSDNQGGGDGVIINGAKVVIIDTASTISTIPYPGNGSFVYAKDTKGFYIAVDGAYILLNDISEQKIYLSFSETQNLSGEEKYLVNLNAGNVISKLEDVAGLDPAEVYEGQVVFAIQEGKHYRLIDRDNSTITQSWQELYLSLSDGGTVLGDVILSNSYLRLSNTFNKEYLPYNDPAYDSLFIGAEGYTEGLAVWRSDENIIFSSQDNNKGFKFITQGGTDQYLNPLNMIQDKVGISGPIDFNYNLTVNGPSIFKTKSYFNSGFRSPLFSSGINGIGFDLGVDSLGKWTLEVDRLITRESVDSNQNQYKTVGLDGTIVGNYSTVIIDAQLIESIDVNVLGSKAGKYSNSSGTIMPLIDKTRYVQLTRTSLASIYEDEPVIVTELVDLAFGIGDRTVSNTVVSYTTYAKLEDNSYAVLPGTVRTDTINVYEVIPNSAVDSFEVGDLLYYRRWDADRIELSSIYAEVVLVGESSIILYCYNNSSLVSTDTLIKIGNRITQEYFMQWNASDNNNPFFEVVNNIESFNDLIENFYYTPFDNEDNDDKINNTFRKPNVRVRQGLLSGIEDLRLGLTVGPQAGLYSDNAYIRGNFDSTRHMMGDQLLFEDGVLTIVDLEIIKSRNITGANGLNGGGNLYAGNIVINHNAKTWVDKTALTGGVVISNLTIDAYGHPTNWTTRTLTTTDIAEGTRLYYTDARADNRINIQKGVAGGIVPLNSSVKIDTIYLPDSILGAVRYQGTYNVATNTPTLPAANAASKGFYYIVTTAGTTGGITYDVGDWIISDGTAWAKVDNSDSVTTVFGRLGNVVANVGDYNTSQVTENTANLYYTNARVKTYGDTQWSLLGHTHTFASLTSKPTTIAGYGITDAYTKTESDARFYPLTANPAGYITAAEVPATGVTSVSSANANIVVTNPTTTPILTLASTITSNTSGNAATATVLQTGRTINGITFNGSVNITIPAVTSVAMTTPTGLSITGSPITTSGTLALTLTSGYSIPTIADQNNWDTAYGWGDYRQYGLGASYVITDYNTVPSYTFARNSGLSTANAPTLGVHSVWTTGNAVNLNTSGLGGQLVLGYSNTAGNYAQADLYIRSKATATTWNSWVKIYHEGNFTPGAYVLKAGDTMTGQLNGTTASYSGTVTATGAFTATGTTSVNRGLLMQTGASPRWLVYTNAAAESGSNVGSDFAITRYSDAGANIGTPMVISRSTGNINFNGTVTATGQIDLRRIDGTLTSQKIIDYTFRATNQADLNFYSQNGNSVPVLGMTIQGIAVPNVVFVGNAVASAVPTVGAHLTNKTYVDGLVGDYVLKAGDIMTGPLSISGPATSTRILWFKTDANNRWGMYADPTAEGAEGIGSNFGLASYSNDGLTGTLRISVNRLTGTVALIGNTSVAGATIISGYGLSVNTGVAIIGTNSNLLLRGTTVTGANYMEFQNNAGTRTAYIGHGSSGTNDLMYSLTAVNWHRFYSNGVERVTIKDTILEVNTPLRVYRTNGQGWTDISNENGTTAIISKNNASAVYSQMQFIQANNTASDREAMRIDTAGTLNLLSGGLGLTLKATIVAGNNYMQFQNNAATVMANIGMVAGSTNDLYFALANNNTHRFTIQGVEQLAISTTSMTSTVGFSAPSVNATNALQGGYLGVNGVATAGNGVSLYNGASAGMPVYGLAFALTSLFGTHGSVTSDYATYFTMTGSTNRGWIFKSSNGAGGNAASITAAGAATFDTQVVSAQMITTSTGFASRTLHGLRGDYTQNGNSDKIIWTIGDTWNTIATMYGIGYQFNSKYATGQHQIVFRENGTVRSGINLSSGAAYFDGTVYSNAGLYVASNNAATNRGYITQTAGLSRWFLSTNATAETGSNAGSDFNIIRYNDAGATLGTALSISRATGNTIFSGNVSSNPAPTLGDHLTNKTYVDSLIGGGAYELLSNKQNDLTTDGTNTKYPTVTAVIAGLSGKANLTGGNVFRDTQRFYSSTNVEVLSTGTLSAGGLLGGTQLLGSWEFSSYVGTTLVNKQILTANTDYYIAPFSGVRLPFKGGTLDCVDKATRTLSADTTLAGNDQILIANTGASTITLPAANTLGGRRFAIYSTTSSPVTISSPSFIANYGMSISLLNGESVLLQSMSNSWVVLAISRIPYIRTYTVSGNGTSTSIVIPHTRTGITANSSAHITAKNAVSGGFSHYTIDATNITIVYNVAPPSGTGNLSYTISITP